MSAIRRLALGFPLGWNHHRGYDLSALHEPGAAPYFITWEPGTGVYGEDFTVAPRDAAGVLLSGAAKHYHFIRIAQFALHRYGVWRTTEDERARADFLAQATFLRDAQRPDGAYRFAFPWVKYGAGAGWISAMAQGEAISVLLRAEREQPQQGFLDAALRAARPFAFAVADGGVTWFGRNGDTFFEEIAEPCAPHVLNGCIFALFGLWELQAPVREAWRGNLIDACVQTLVRWISRYDTGWWTLYNLMRSAGGHAHVATLKYHAFHVAQFRVLAEMFGASAFAEAADRWEHYARRRGSRARVIMDACISVPERLLGGDTAAGGAHT